MAAVQKRSKFRSDALWLLGRTLHRFTNRRTEWKHKGNGVVTLSLVAAAWTVTRNLTEDRGT